MVIEYASAGLQQGNWRADLTIFDVKHSPERPLSVFYLTMQVYCTALDVSKRALVCSGPSHSTAGRSPMNADVA
jgi:hypothetical protein